LQWNGVDKFALYNYKQDPLLEKQIPPDHQGSTLIMERLLKAIIQQYNNRMIDNRLTAK
jgi:hypothetical protein